MRELTVLEQKEVRGSEAITLTLVCACLAVSIFVVVGWKLYQSSKGVVQIPGGFKFSWNAVKNNIANAFRR